MKTYELLTLTGVLYRARMIFMDKGTFTSKMAPNQTPKEKLYLRNSFHGEDFGVFFPVGLVLVSQQNKIVTANPELEDLLEIPKGSLAGKSDQDFFRLLLALVRDPDYVQSALVDAVQNIDKWPVIKLDLRSESQKQLEIIMFPTEFTEKSASEWGVLIIDRSVEKLVYNRQVKMLREMSKETRKNSPGDQENITPISANLQPFNKDII